ncbi:MAG: putative proteasome activator complex subunit 3 [Streblomastix strix]|uniref:Putative proteasome activator complex subunit 3 n=1 Tax=Streblomastix strix TaxID=222440 RepID=A0A5J4WYU9_9EUKA|nr:MAG: putative proteasome activator complex subunit 3 [Streblomastix strix]
MSFFNSFPDDENCFGNKIRMQTESQAKISIFAQKAKEIDDIIKMNICYLSGESKETKEALKFTIDILDHPERLSAPSNKIICDMDEEINKHLNEIIDHLYTFRIWFALQKPAISEGNSFDAAVVEEMIDSIIKYEEYAQGALDCYQTYAEERGRLFTKFFKNPYYEDIRIAIIDLDQRELSGNLTILYDVRDAYLTLHDCVVKNFDRLKNPIQSVEFAPNAL